MRKKPYYPENFETPKTIRPPDVLSTGWYRKEFGYFVHRSKGTRDWQMIYTLSGTGIVEDLPHVYECREGDLVLIPPGTMHEYYTAEGEIWEEIWCHFTPRPSFYSWLALSKDNRGVLYLPLGQTETKQRVEQALKRLILYNSAEEGPLFQELAINALEEAILLVSTHQWREETARLDPRIQMVVNDLMQNFSKPFHLNEFAQRACLSPSRLSHLFKEQVGQSISEMLLKYRLKQAARLMRYTAKSIEEICLSVGFNSPPFFSRKFKEYYGMSPAVYKKQYKHSEHGSG